MGDLGWGGLVCVLAPVAIILAILARAVLITRRRRGADPLGEPLKDNHMQAFDLGRAPTDADRWTPGPGV